MNKTEDLTTRQQDILRRVIESYVGQGRPVGSETIAGEHHEKLSPATVRNVLHELEQLSFIWQPHTSAGRIPTDSGYRYYVDCLMSEAPVAPHVEAIVLREYRSPKESIESLVRRTSRMLSELSIQAGFVLFPNFEEMKLKQIEFMRVGEAHLLIVWMTENGLVQSQAVRLAEPLENEDMIRMTRYLNDVLAGVSMSRVQDTLQATAENKSGRLPSFFRQVCELVEQGFPSFDQKHLVWEGSRHLLDQPEFQDWKRSRKLFRAIEGGRVLANVLASDLSATGVQIRIGRENRYDEMMECTLVTAPYEVNEHVVGSLGILGPRRMAYDQVVSLVHYISERFGEALEEW